MMAEAKIKGGKRQLVLEEPLMVKLEPALKKRLKMECVRQNTDMSKFTREAIEEKLDRVAAARQRRTNDDAEAAAA